MKTNWTFIGIALLLLITFTGMVSYKYSLSPQTKYDIKLIIEDLTHNQPLHRNFTYEENAKFFLELLTAD